MKDRNVRRRFGTAVLAWVAMACVPGLAAESAADAEADREAEERQAEAEYRAEMEAARAAFLERERVKQSERQPPVPVPDLGDTVPVLPPQHDGAEP